MARYREIFFRTHPSNHGWYYCKYCGKALRAKDLDVDHEMPRFRGGTDDPNNLTAACPHCNRSKGFLTPDEFELWLEDQMFREEDRFIEDCDKYGEDTALNRAIRRICRG